MKFKTLYIFFLLFIFSKSMAQIDTLVVEPAVLGKGKVINNKIALKWNVNDPFFWKISLKSGYKVQRTTVLRDGQPINRDETVILKEVLKPLPLEEWKPLVVKDSLVLVVAQAIYGEDFDTTKKEKSVNSMMILNNENQQRYAFSLMAAEQSYLATKAAGWGLEDETAKPNEKYVYTITLLGLKKPIIPATIYIGLDEKNDSTPPVTPDAIFGNQTVMLIWDFKSQQSLFSSYILEKSSDGINYRKVTGAVIYPMESKSSYVSYSDALEKNGVKYYYRIKGIDAFGIISEPSKVVSGEGLNFLEYSPQVTAKAALDDETVSIEWTFPMEGETKVSGFHVLQAPTESGDFQTIKEDVPVTTRKLVFKATLAPSNYFKIRAIAKQGGFKDSYPMLVQPIDSIPPMPPIDLEGVIDSLGVVKLKWKKNLEADFYGYKVFRGNSKNEEFIQITNKVLLINQFKDSINAKSLNKKVFYKLIALDQRYNESPFSKIVEIKKVDKIPPSSPIISDYILENDRVTIKFKQSQSEDVQKHILYRRKESEKDWKVLFETSDKKIDSYDDKDLDGKTIYYYTIVARDDSGNESEPSEPLIVDPIPVLTKPAIKNFTSIVDINSKSIELYWSTKEKEVVEYQLYKKKKEDGYILYKIFQPVKKNFFIDSNIKVGNTYFYAIRAIYQDGTMSQFKEVIAVY